MYSKYAEIAKEEKREARKEFLKDLAGFICLGVLGYVATVMFLCL